MFGASYFAAPMFAEPDLMFAAGTSRSLPYTVKVAAGTSRSLPYTVKRTIGVSRQLKWIETGYAGRGLSMAWRVVIAAPPASVIKEFLDPSLGRRQYRRMRVSLQHRNAPVGWWTRGVRR